jgi:hypothetical protein
MADERDQDERREHETDGGTASGVYPEDFIDAADDVTGTRSDHAGEASEGGGDSNERLTGYGRTLPGFTKRHEDAVEKATEDMDVPPGGVARR